MVFWFWIILTSIGLILLSLFAVVVLSKLVLKVYAAFVEVNGRDIAKYDFSDGAAMRYEPGFAVKKFIGQYLIYRLNGKSHQWFIGEFAQKLSSIEYSIVAYGRRKNALRVYHVKEKNCEHFTRATLLPGETSFISLIVNRVNGKRIPRERSFRPNGYVWLGLLGLNVAAVLVTLLWLVVRLVASLEGSNAYDILSADAWGAILWATFIVFTALPVMVTALLQWIQKRRDESGRRSSDRFAKIWTPIQGFFGKLVGKVYKCLQVIGRAIVKCSYKVRNFFWRVFWAIPILKLKYCIRQMSYKTKLIFRKLSKKAK